MGYASYLEDILEAGQGDAAGRFSSHQEAKPPQHVRATRRRRRDIVSGYHQLVEATVRLRRENATLVQRVQELEAQLAWNDRVRQNNVALRDRVRVLEGDLAIERNRRRRLESQAKEFERRVCDAPGGIQRMVDAYSEPADIDFFKPGERRRR